MATKRTTCGICNGAGRTGSEFRDKAGELRRVLCGGCNGVGKVDVEVPKSCKPRPKRR